ncbi:MAG: MFS transporter [Gammaproteobacteria bacterium]
MPSDPKPFTESLYEKLTNVEDARACADIPDAACRESPRNFLLLLASSFLTRLGDALANPKTVLAWLMSSLGAPSYMLGALVPIRESGSLLPQLVIASFVRRMPRRKWAWVAGAVLQALAVAGIAAVAVSLEGVAAGWALLALLAAFSLARGLCSVAAKDVTGKTVPRGSRGQLTGWADGSAGLVTVGAGFALLLGVAGDGAPAFFGWALAGAGLLWLLAAGVYAAVEEFPGETGGGGNAMREAIARLALLRDDPPFRHFVATRSLLLCSALTAPFLVALGQERVGTGAALLGLFVLASGGASLAAAPFWGRFADRSSRQVMVIAATLTAATGLGVVAIDLLWPALTRHPGFLPLAYFVLSVAHGGVRVGRKTYIIDLAGGNKRTDYVAVSNTVIGVVLLVTSLVGALAVVVGVRGMLLLLSLMGALGALSARRLPEANG